MPEKIAKYEAAVQEEVEDDAYGSPAGMNEFLTRGEVATILRVSIATIRRWQGKELHPRRDDAGTYLFDPQEVEAVRARRPPPPEARMCKDAGEIGAEAFKLFRDGVDVRDVVISLQRPPGEIWALYKQWEEMGNAIVLSDQVLGQLSRLVRHRLLADTVLEGIENDDYEVIRDFINDSLGARPKRKGR
jgi:hypothetical protein